MLRCGARGGEEVRVDPAKLTVHADERPPILLGRSLYLAAERHGRDLVIARARAAPQIHAAGGVVDVILVVHSARLDGDLVMAREVEPVDRCFIY